MPMDRLQGASCSTCLPAALLDRLEPATGRAARALPRLEWRASRCTKHLAVPGRAGRGDDDSAGAGEAAFPNAAPITTSPNDGWNRYERARAETLACTFKRGLGGTARSARRSPSTRPTSPRRRAAVQALDRLPLSRRATGVPKLHSDSQVGSPVPAEAKASTRSRATSARSSSRRNLGGAVRHLTTRGPTTPRCSAGSAERLAEAQGEAALGRNVSILEPFDDAVKLDRRPRWFAPG